MLHCSGDPRSRGEGQYSVEEESTGGGQSSLKPEYRVTQQLLATTASSACAPKTLHLNLAISGIFLDTILFEVWSDMQRTIVSTLVRCEQVNNMLLGLGCNIIC